MKCSGDDAQSSFKYGEVTQRILPMVKDLIKSNAANNQLNKLINHNNSNNNDKYQQQQQHHCHSITPHIHLKTSSSNAQLTPQPTKSATTYSFDTFFIFISLIISYWLKMKGYTVSTWVLPIPICFVLTKAKLLCLSDSLMFCMLLKIARFLIYHYRLIIVISVLSVVLPLLKSKKVLVCLAIFIPVYLFAKYINNYNRSCLMVKEEIYEDVSSMTSSENDNNNNNGFNF
jgi:hypothetical protein